MKETESLNLIREMIDKAKGKVGQDSVHYLLWGWLVFASAIIHYALIQMDHEMPWLPWVILMPIGGVVAFIIGMKQSKNARSAGYFGRIMGYVWGGFVISMLLILFSGPRIGWEASYTMLIALYGLSTFISGGILRFRPLILGGICAWMISLACVFADMETILLLMALSMVTSYLIPGYLLRKAGRDEKA